MKFNQKRVQVNFHALIPARYASTRLSHKLLRRLGNQTVIQTTYKNVVATQLFTDVVVITDAEAIKNNLEEIGAHVVYNPQYFESGTDRIAAYAQTNIPDDTIIVNVQGDEPFVSAETLQTVQNIFLNNTQAQVVTVVTPIPETNVLEKLQNPNVVKVVRSNTGAALYFSRSPIPYNRDNTAPVTYFEHIGLYAFTKKALMQFTEWQPGQLEQIEKLEQLRFLENNVPIYTAVTAEAPIKIDTLEDLEAANQYLRALNS